MSRQLVGTAHETIYRRRRDFDSANGAQLSSQQQRMKDCNAQASGISCDARKQFMSSCLSGATAGTKKHCTTGKPCGSSCIAKDKVCYQP